MADRLRPDGWTLSALAIVVIQTVWRGMQAFRGYFWQDDFHYLADVQGGLDADVLLQSYNGHLMPGTFFLSWLVTLAGTSHVIAALQLVVMGLLASLLLVWLLRLLFGDHPFALVGLAVALFTPLTLVGTTWYAYGLQLWPLQISMLGALVSYVSWTRSRRRLWVVAGALFLVLGLGFWQKALLVVPAVLLFALLAAPVRGLGAKERTRRLWTHRTWFLPPIVIALLYGVGYLLLTHGEAPEGATRATNTTGGTSFFGLVDNGLFRLLLPGLLGGPWSTDGGVGTLNPSPHDAVLAIVALAWVAIIGGSFVYRGAVAAPAWIWLLVMVLVDLALLLAFRGFASADIARDSRYIADLVPLAAVALVWAYVPLRALSASTEQSPSAAESAADSGDEVTTQQPGSHVVSDTREPDWVRGGVLLGVAAVLASSWITVQPMGDQLSNVYARNYVNGLKEAVSADPDRPVLRTEAPGLSVLAGKTDEVARAMDIRIRWARVGTDLQLIDPIGRLRPVATGPGSWSRRGPARDCGWLLTRERPLTVAIPPPRFPVDQVVQVGYLSGAPRPLQIDVTGGEKASLRTEGGLGVVTLATEGKASKVTISTPTAGPAVCITDIGAGRPAASSRSR